MRDERGGKPEAFMHSEGDTDLAEFWTALGGEGAVATAGMSAIATYSSCLWSLI